MNKTIIININGIVFHIEEDAYEVLRKYMIDVKQHFAYTEDCDEIVVDIENRIAEMFTERLAAEDKQVILMTDVDAVLMQMGTVNDFESTEENGNSEEAYYKPEKKLFRDMDDRIIGGVCAGVAHYFNLDPKWVRLLTVILVIFGGTGVMVYIILWIIMPKAVTRADRMAMKGEPVNLQNIKKNFDDEFAALNKNFNHARKEAQPFLNNLGQFIREFVGHLARFVSVAAKLLIKLIGGFIFLFGAAMLVALIIGLVGFFGWNSADLSYFPYNFINKEYQSPVFLSAFIILFIPLIALVFFATRVLFNKSVISRSTSFILLIVWLCGVGMGVYYGFKIGSEFQEEATLSKVKPLAPYSNYHLVLNNDEILTAEQKKNIEFLADSADEKVTVKSSKFEDNRISLEIIRADVAIPTLTEEYSAKGSTFEKALQNARNIIYPYIQADSVIKISRYASRKQNTLWRDQEVNLTLRIPLNTELIIDGDLNDIVNNYNLWNCKEENAPWNTPTTWVMTNEGLKCKNDSLYKKNTE